MKTSETISAIAPALLQAQKAITFASKDAVNAHFKNSYADLSSVIEAVKSALNDAGVVFLQTPTPSDPGFLALTTRLLHTSGEWIEDIAVCPLGKNDAQGFGSAMTYLRRYSLAAITGVYQDDDDGNAASVKPKQEKIDGKKPASQPDQGNIDESIEVIAKMDSAKDLSGLVTIMNGLPAETKKLVTTHFHNRISELKKAQS